MRAFHGIFATETNTFSPIPTDIASFLREPRGGERRQRALEPLASRGAAVFGGFQAYAEPSAPIGRRAYETLRDKLLAKIEAVLPLDYVVLGPARRYGCVGYEDCEGDVLTRIRALVRPAAAVGATLDLHCHLTERMIAAADLLIAYKEYAHVDAGDRLRELVIKLIGLHERRTRPVPSLCCVPAIGLYPTDREPLRTFVDDLFALENSDGIVSISVAYGFPWGDVTDMGTKVLVYSDGAPERGASLARELGERLFDMRENTFETLVPCRRAVAEAVALPGLTVLADLADNPGGGAPGDSTLLLGELLTAGASGVPFGALWDPVAVAFAMETGEGERIPLRIGGKTAPASGKPLDVTATIVALRRDYRVPLWDIDDQHYGDCAAIRTGDGIEIVLASQRAQTYSPAFFENIGVRLCGKRIVGVKSAHHFNREFRPIADRVMYVSSPGALSMDYKTIPYRRVERPIWPLDDLSTSTWSHANAVRPRT